jgi:4-amino-4-deoxy-L-arabinose transferase-like glycosyltransferase
MQLEIPGPKGVMIQADSVPAKRSPEVPVPARGQKLALGLILACGLVIRLILWWGAKDQALPISDERDYSTLAVNLVRHGEFGFSEGELTSLRPPLYPAMVAGIYWLFGEENYQAVRLMQVALSLATTLLVYFLGCRIYSSRVGFLAAGLYTFYPSLLGYTNLVLTETLFTFLLIAFCTLLLSGVEKKSFTLLGLAGLTLGLATLTRSILWLFPPILGVFLLFAWPDRFLNRLAAAGIVTLAFCATIAPWTIRNTVLQKTFITIDVMGGRNFMLGNYQYTPLYRSWDAIALTGEKSWIWEVLQNNSSGENLTQGQIDKIAMRQGIKFAMENPGLTCQRTLIKFFDFWGLERELIAGAAQGIFGSITKPFLVVLACTIAGSYALAIFAGIFGVILTPPADKRWLIFFLLIIGFICGIHAVVFGHSRYHLPLMPIVLIFAANALVNARFVSQQRGRLAFWASCGLCLVLVAGWVWMFLAVDKDLFLQSFGS